MSDDDRVISVVKLPDGRYGVRNECDVSDLDRDDIEQMAAALAIWFDLKWRRAADREDG